MSGAVDDLSYGECNCIYLSNGFWSSAGVCPAI